MANLLSIKIIGDKDVQFKLNKFSFIATQKVKEVVNESALNIRNYAVQSMSEPKSGRRYKVGEKRFHIASAPGEAPATDTGVLKSSVRPWFYMGGLAAEIGTDVKYGRYLEFGTSKMRPRPWLNPAFEKEKPNYLAALVKALKQAEKQV